jgi:hypothetical protein
LTRRTPEAKDECRCLRLSKIYPTLRFVRDPARTGRRRILFLLRSRTSKDDIVDNCPGDKKKCRREARRDTYNFWKDCEVVAFQVQIP